MARFPPSFILSFTGYRLFGITIRGARLYHSMYLISTGTTANTTLPVWAMVAIPIAALLGGICLWCAVLWINSRISGWHAVARRFPLPTGFHQPDTISHAVIGNVGWKVLNPFTSSFPVMQVAPLHEGLHLSIVPIFGFGYRPLLIPWNQLHNPRKALGIIQKMVSITIGDNPSQTLYLPLHTYETALAPHLNLSSPHL